MVRVGIGYDVHRMVEGRPLVLGGVRIPYSRGLAGHSDADVLIHAICDAIFGALGEGDIGSFFPDTNTEWRSAPSRVFLEKASELISERRGKVSNIDSTIIAEKPKMSPYINAMRGVIAEVLGVGKDAVGIKATTNEKMGFVGREEGIAAMAVASLWLPD
ncbi:MAG: 2-C-methyl-D-erythritol 2,4-cyclodiphosphate synthase [Verrucomicrobia bacterium]|nr:2-C-methyl-D-erythritol 2,4-cyclodiphosphate synthase [Verrucomicrobiota bacterium]